MRRGDFLKVLGVSSAALAVAPVLTATAAVNIGKGKPEPLPMLSDDYVLTSASWRALVGRVNELSGCET